MIKSPVGPFLFTFLIYAGATGRALHDDNPGPSPSDISASNLPSRNGIGMSGKIALSLEIKGRWSIEKRPLPRNIFTKRIRIVAESRLHLIVVVPSVVNSSPSEIRSPAKFEPQRNLSPSEIQGPAKFKPQRNPSSSEIQAPAKFKAQRNSSPSEIQGPAKFKPQRNSSPSEIQAPAKSKPQRNSSSSEIQAPAKPRP
jgi:hypothetical protein